MTKTIGIFGGGQLAKMIALDGYYMGFDFNIYDPNEFACSKNLSKKFYNFDFLDEKNINDFFSENEIITYEFENIEADFLKTHENKIPQGIMALEVLQDRFKEKNFINGIEGAKTVGFQVASEKITMKKPFICKTRLNGYDGKGQFLIGENDHVPSEILCDDYIMEEYLEDIKEYSVIIGRSVTGKMAFYEPIENVHRRGILHSSTFAKDLKEEHKDKMIEKAKKIIEALDYHGVLCVEFFVSKNEVYVNEIAPRVHNSGHLTIEASNISQFKLHLHCILGLPIPKIISLKDYYMVNILGHELEKAEEMQMNSELSFCNFHIYGKNSYAKNRKVGHITFLNENNELKKVENKIHGAMATNG